MEVPVCESHVDEDPLCTKTKIEIKQKEVEEAKCLLSEDCLKSKCVSFLYVNIYNLFYSLNLCEI